MDRMGKQYIRILNSHPHPPNDFFRLLKEDED